MSFAQPGTSPHLSSFTLIHVIPKRVNLFGADEARVDALFGGLLDQWRSGGGGKQGEAAAIDPGQIEVLKSLGYLE